MGVLVGYVCIAGGYVSAQPSTRPSAASPHIEAVVLRESPTKQKTLVLEVYGRALASYSVIRWDGATLQTTVLRPDDVSISSVEQLVGLRAEAPQTGFTDGGHHEVRIYTPPPGGGLSLPMMVVTKRQSFYRMPWVYYLLLIAGGLVLAGFGAHHWRKRQYVERTRRRIANDLHDDIGSKISSLAMFMDYASRKPRLDAQDRQRLQRYVLVTRQLVRDVRDTIWLIDADRDHLRALVQRMRDVARQMTGGRVGLVFTVQHSSEVFSTTGETNRPDESDRGNQSEGEQRMPALPLDMTWRRAVFFLFKEAVHNAVRHAEAEEIRIAVAWKAPQFKLLVEDDGKGFDVTRTCQGRGLRSLHERAEEAGGTLSLESRQGQGAILRFEAPVHTLGWKG